MFDLTTARRQLLAVTSHEEVTIITDRTRSFVFASTRLAPPKSLPVETQQPLRKTHSRRMKMCLRNGRWQLSSGGS